MSSIVSGLRRKRCRYFLLGLTTALVCLLLYLSLLEWRRPTYYRLKLLPSSSSHAECSKLKSLIINSTWEMFDRKTFFQIVKDLHGCPWEQNENEINLLQFQLTTCCDASYSLTVTQENCPIGYKLSYEEEEHTETVTEDLYNLFPKESPFQEPLGRCAVVGNGGILSGSFCGAEIDRANFVFRMNLPPLGWISDVGTKTDLVTANPKILMDIFGKRMSDREALIDALKEFNSSLVLLRPFSLRVNTEVSLKALHIMEEFKLNNRVLFSNPEYIRRLATYWSKDPESSHLSSSLIVVSAAVEMCKELTLYGFWPFYEDLNGGQIPHHYYDNVRPELLYHEMPGEFYHFLQMHAQGALRLNVGQCSLQSR